MDRFSQSVTAQDFVQNPYPAYDRARATGDLVHWDAYDMPAAMSHRAVRLLLTSRALGRTPPPGLAPPRLDHIKTWQQVEDHSMLELEPPTHTRLRKLVLRAFTGKRVAAMGDQISAAAHHLIDQFPETPFDFLNRFARPLPVTVIANLLGVPLDRTDDLLRWSNAMVAMYQSGRDHTVEQTAERASQDLVAYLDDVIAHRRRTPGPDLITELIAAEEDGDKLSGAELTSTVILLLNAGHEATVHTLGNAVQILAPLAPTPVTDTLVEELLRFDPPLHIFTRWAYEDVDCFGTVLPKHSQVACVLAAANRDPAIFDAPHQFLPDRPARAHQSFGAGLHFCVGAPLARLEIKLGLKALFDRHPNLKIVQPAQYADTYHFHGLTQLMVQI